jgi:hypothetical protein
MHSHRHLSYLAALALAQLEGCAGPTPAPDQPDAWTPPRHVEHRLLFARPDSRDPDLMSLRHVHQVVGPAERAQAIKAGDPVSIIVNDVRLPRDFKGPRDVVVLLDIQSGSPKGTASYAVWYQRRVTGGQKLGFDSLLVWSDPAWSPVDPPRFTLRVIDVSSERNQETQRVLDELQTSIGTLASFVPHPAWSGAAAAVRAASLVLANRANTTIIDFTPQFYGADFIEASGEADLPPFMQGSWLVVGRPAGLEEPERFWSRPLALDRRSGEILAGDEPRQSADCPYVRLTVAAADAAVPTAVLDHSAAILKLLSQSSPDPAMVQAATGELLSSLTAFSVHKRFLSQRSNAALGEVFAALDDPNLRPAERTLLLRLLGRITGESFGDAHEASRWWSVHRASGNVDASSGRWVRRE